MFLAPNGGGRGGDWMQLASSGGSLGGDRMKGFSKGGGGGGEVVIKPWAHEHGTIGFSKGGSRGGEFPNGIWAHEHGTGLGDAGTFFGGGVGGRGAMGVGGI